MDLDYFLKINNTSGTTSKKDTQLYNLKSQVNDRFTDTIDFYNVKVSGVSQDLLIVRTTVENKKTIKSRPNEDFKIGDIVVWNNNNWLVTAKDTGNQVYTSGKMELCNYTLPFQSPTDYSILYYPCITSGKTYSNDENQVITLPSNQKSIWCCFDENTSLIKTGDRFYVDKLNKTTWHVIGAVDNTTYSYGTKGLIYFVVEQDLVQNNTEYPDRPDLGICNYREPSVVPPTPVGEYSLNIQPSNDLIIGGDEVIFTPTLKDADGNIQEFTAIWSFIYPTGYQSSFHDTYDGNKCLIKVDEVYEVIGEKFLLTCTTSDGLYSTNFNATVTAGW